MYIYARALCMVELQTEQPEPPPFCSPGGFSPRRQPRPTVGHGWGPQGTQWPSSRISRQPGITVGAQGSRLPRGMNYRAINHARLSRRVLCPPSIRRHKQLHSQQDWQKARHKWVHGDPGDLGGGPGQAGRARHLGTPRPQCPRSAKRCSAGDVVLAPFLPIQPLLAPAKGPGGGDGWWPWSPGCWAAASLI